MAPRGVLTRYSKCQVRSTLISCLGGAWTALTKMDGGIDQIGLCKDQYIETDGLGPVSKQLIMLTTRDRRFSLYVHAFHCFCRCLPSCSFVSDMNA